MSDAMLLRRLFCAAKSLLPDEEEEEEEEEEDVDDDGGESTDKAVLAEVPSSSSSSAARFLPRPLVCFDPADDISEELMVGAQAIIDRRFLSLWCAAGLRSAFQDKYLGR